MPDSSNTDIYFTKHLFRTGLECPTRLFYYANDYPENREALPFIKHYRYNKQQLKNLACCSFPKGIAIDSSSIEGGYADTRRYVQKKRVVLFDAVFLHNRFKAKVPILEKKGNEVKIYHIQTRAFRPEKHRISNREGIIYSKWLDYVLDFAFQVYVIGKCYPEWNIQAYFLLPEKYAHAKTEGLHEVIRRVNEGELKPGKSSVDDEEILCRVDVSEEINRVLSGKVFSEGPFQGQDFEQVLQKMSDSFYSGKKYPVTIGGKCKSCEFRIERERVEDGEKSGFVECWNSALNENLEKDYKPLVFNLIGPGTKQWIERGIYLQEDVPEGEYYGLNAIDRTGGKINEKQRQSLQILQAKGEQVPDELVKLKLYSELDRWEYPIHFLDFEAGNYVIPMRKGRRPYHLLVFQYSCHTLLQDGSWQHHEWLDERNGEYPNFEMIRRLKEVPRILEGTIVQYSNFERNALKTIRKELIEEKEQVPDADELTGWMDGIIKRHDSSHKSGPFLSDLSRLVKNYYYNAEMGNSLSIKDVLQSVMAMSPRLKEMYSRPYNSSNYDSIVWWQQDENGSVMSPYRLMINGDRDKGIRRGTEAMAAYARLLSENLHDSEEKSCRKALLRYCELDTLAMFMIFQHWRYLKEENWN